MSDTAFQNQYRQEFILGFEQMQSVVRDTVVTEAMIKGNQAIFLTADSGGSSAVTRGVNGLIPARADNLTQNTAVVQEWHDLVRKTGFNIFASQGDQRRIMQVTTMGVINRKIDDDILGQLALTTYNTGSAVTASLALAMKAKTILGVNQVPMGNNIFAVISPAFEAYLMQQKEFTSVNYVNQKPFEKVSSDGANYEQYTRFYWAGVQWIVHPRVTGVGTSSETCFMYHRNSIGHAVDRGNIQSPVGYFDEQDYSWARCSVFMGSKLLQAKGAVIMYHDGSAYVTS